MTTAMPDAIGEEKTSLAFLRLAAAGVRVDIIVPSSPGAVVARCTR